MRYAKGGKWMPSGAERAEMAEEFANDIDRWVKDGQPDDGRFILSYTGDVLQGMGAIESDIYMNAEKINIIFGDHFKNGVTIDEIKAIPQIINEPILILKSKKKNRYGRSRIVIFGDVKTKKGKPVISILDLRPVEKDLLIEDMQKLTSAYVKTQNPVDFVKTSDVLYISENKNRATSLGKAIGLRMPITFQKTGSIGSISYVKRGVNIRGEKFSDVVMDGDDIYMKAVEEGNMEEAQRLVDEAAKAAGYRTGQAKPED